MEMGRTGSVSDGFFEIPSLTLPARKNLDRGRTTSDETLHLGAAFGTTTGAAAHFARLFVVFPPTHFLLDPGVLDQLAKPLDRFRDVLVLTQP